MKKIQNLVMASNALALDDHNLRPGMIAASNTSRFDAANFSEPLTGYALGWRDPENLDQLLEQLFPSIEVGRRFQFRKGKNAEAFLSEDDDVRAIGSNFKKVEYTGEMVDSSTKNKGLTIMIDKDDEVGPDFLERYTAALMNRLVRNELRRGVSILNGAATNVNKVWDATKNPDADVRVELRTAKGVSGLRPNTVAMGGAAWDLRASAYEGQNTPYAGRAASMNPNDLALKLMVKQVVVSEVVYGATAKNELIDSVAYLYNAQQGLMKDDPSHVKRFVSPTPQGRFRVYVEQKSTGTALTVEHYSNIVATDLTGIRKITASND